MPFYLANIIWVPGKNKILHYVVISTLAFTLYANTLSHGFVLDDEVVLSENQFVKKGIDGISSIFTYDSFGGYGRVEEGKEVVEGGRYRPLSIALFAVLHSVFGTKAFVYHFLSVFLYVTTCCILFKLFTVWLKDYSHGQIIAVAATFLFVVHPVHTEVVANIKSCDEQLALLFGLLACVSFFRAWDNRKFRWSVLAAIFFLLACLSKENAIIWIFIIPASLWFFRHTRIKDVLWPLLTILSAAILFLVIRIIVLGEANPTSIASDPLNNPFLTWNGNAWVAVSVGERTATILYTFWYYIRLLIVPYPLTHNYYPHHIEIQNFNGPYVWVGLVLLVGLVVLVLSGIKRKSIISLGTIFFLLSLLITLNIFFPVGTFMAERFLYLPSVGFVLAAVVMPVYLHQEKKLKWIGPMFYSVVIVFAILTFIRNKDWKDNKTLLTKDAATSSNSIKLHNDLGTLLLTEALQSQDPDRRVKLLNDAAIHLKFAVDNHPTYYDAFLAYGANTYYLQRYNESVSAYRHAQLLYPGDPMARTGLVFALQGHGIDTGLKGNTQEAIRILTEAWALQPDTTSALELANYYSVLDQHDKAVEWLEQANKLAPGNERIANRLKEEKELILEK